MFSKNIAPYKGAQIRVNRGLYSHHGIYVSDDLIIHFASNEPGHETDPLYASVCKTDLKGFLKGGELEVREYTEEEMREKRGNDEIVEYVLSNLGRKGYDLINNNCEHFSNECAFGKSYSSQVESVLSLFKNLGF